MIAARASRDHRPAIVGSPEYGKPAHDAGCVGGAAGLDGPQPLGRGYRAALLVASVLARSRGSYPAASCDRPSLVKPSAAAKNSSSSNRNCTSLMLTRNIRIEEDLIDQLFNSSEKRLARKWLLARYGEPEASHRMLPRVSQETLAEMVGTTRSRGNFFMNRFRKLGFIEYNGGLKINNSLLSVVLRD
jgi:hypothetical protein